MAKEKRNLLIIAMAILVMALLAAVTLSTGIANAAVVETSASDSEIGEEFAEAIDTEDTLSYSISEDGKQCEIQMGETCFTVSQPYTIAEPTRPGYRFEGWYADADYTDRVTEIDSAASGTLFAKWVEKPLAEMYDAASDTYDVYTYSQLDAIRTLKTYSGQHAAYVINKNIALRSTIVAPSDTVWEPIEYSFNGTFQGNNYLIHGLKIHVTKAGNHGLFENIGESGKIYNTYFSAVTITSDIAANATPVNVGVIAGVSVGLISECHLLSVSSLDVDCYKANLGGFVGMMYSYGSIKNSKTYEGVTIEGNGNVGGFVGIATGCATVTNCTNGAEVRYWYKSENGTAGGIAGKTTANTAINSCTNEGLIKYSGNWGINSNKRPCMGQIIGWQLGGNFANCHCEGTTNYSNLTGSQDDYCSATYVGRTPSQ